MKLKEWCHFLRFKFYMHRWMWDGNEQIIKAQIVNELMKKGKVFSHWDDRDRLYGTIIINGAKETFDFAIPKIKWNALSRPARWNLKLKEIKNNVL